PMHRPPTGLYTLSLHDALPIYGDNAVCLQLVQALRVRQVQAEGANAPVVVVGDVCGIRWSIRYRAPFGSLPAGVACYGSEGQHEDRKSTRLNSSHVSISYAVFC